MNSPEQFILEAVQLSRKNMHNNVGGPFGAVVVHQGKIIGRGANQVTSTNDPTAHAEVVAIREACKTLNSFSLHDCEIYTSCEPCPMCLSAIYWARISKIYFANTRDDAAAVGFDDEFLYREVNLPLSQRQIPMLPIGRETALKVFEEWKNKTDKIPY